MKAKPSVVSGLFFAIITLVTTPVVDAATRTKANNADNLNLASSWTNGIVPGNVDIAQFDSTIAAPLTLALGADTTWNQINFVNPGGEVTLSSGNVLTLSNNTPLAFGSGTANFTLNCDLVCAGTAFSTLPSPPTGRILTYGGAIQGRNATIALGATTGTLRLGGSTTTLIGTNIQVKSSGPKLGIGASSTGSPVSSGPLGTNLFIWNSISGTELFAYNGPQSLGNPLRIQASPFIFNSADNLTFSGLVDFNNGTRTVNVISNGVLRFTGTISNSTGLAKTGTGVLELGGTNVSGWNNGLSIFGGTVRLLANNVMPNGASAGTLQMTNTSHVLDMNGFSDTIPGVTGAGGSGDWLGTFDNFASGTTSALTLGDDFTYTVAGMVQNSGAGAKLALVKIGTGGLILTNAKSFSGGITNASASEIFINSAGAAGAGPLVLAQQDAELVYSGGGTLAWSNNIILQTNGVISAADNNTLELAGIISGPGALIRTNTVFQQGPLNFRGDNTYSGGLVLFGGLVIFSHPRGAGLGPFTIGNPTFSGGPINIVPGVNLSGANFMTNAVLVNRDFTVGGTNAIELAGPMVWITNATQRSINVTNLAGAVISGPVSGYGFNKTGQGLLTFNGTCSHNGPSTISVGPVAVGPSGTFTGATTFLVGGSGLLNVSAAPGFAIRTNQTLSGSGKVMGDIVVNGALFPGDVFSTLTFSNNLTLSASSVTTVRISRTFQTTEKAVCYGTLTYGGSLVVSNVGSTLIVGDTFDLFGFTGSPGTFANLTLPTLDPGLTWNVSNLSVDGKISVISLTPASPRIVNPGLQNLTNFVMTVTGGVANGQFRILTQTNVAAPLTNWSTLATNIYDGTGNRLLTNPVDPIELQRYFIIIQP
jgi:fibronectin-binding autotransporter adhesin